MKKTITLPNGQTEVVEGTAEEIAAYEKAKRESANESPKSKKKLLTEEEVRAIAKEEAAKVAPVIHHGVCTCPICCPFKPYWAKPYCQHEYPQGPWLSVLPPNCIKCGEPAAGGVTVTLTSDKVMLDDSMKVSVDAGGNLPFIGTYVSTNSHQA